MISRRQGNCYAQLAGELFRSWPMAWEMAKRDLSSKNKGAILGMAWLFLRPFIHVSAYVLIVTFLMGASGREGPSSDLNYALYILGGIGAWQVLTLSLETSTTLIRDRMELVKQVIYPVETLPITSFLINLAGSSVSLALYLLIRGISGDLGPSLLLLPVAYLLILLFLTGCGWTLMVVGVVFRDISEVVGSLLGLMVYASPVIMSEAMVGPKYWRIIQLNPLSHFVICVRDALDGGWHPASWMIALGLTLVSLTLGGWVIHRMKLAINDYI